MNLVNHVHDGNKVAGAVLRSWNFGTEIDTVMRQTETASTCAQSPEKRQKADWVDPISAQFDQASVFQSSNFQYCYSQHMIAGGLTCR